MLLSERWTKDTELTDSKQKRLIGTLCGKKLSGLFSKQSSLLSRPADRPADICLKMTFTLWRWKFKIFSLYFFLTSLENQELFYSKTVSYDYTYLTVRCLQSAKLVVLPFRWTPVCNERLHWKRFLAWNVLWKELSLRWLYVEK